MRIEFLADRPELLPTLAEWHHAEWGYLHPGSTLRDRIGWLRPEVLREEYRGTEVTIMTIRLAGE